MAHNLPTCVEWLDGTTRDYIGYDIEISSPGVLMLTDPERRPVVIPLEHVRAVTAGGTVLVAS